MFPHSAYRHLFLGALLVLSGPVAASDSFFVWKGGVWDVSGFETNFGEGNEPVCVAGHLDYTKTVIVIMRQDNSIRLRFTNKSWEIRLPHGTRFTAEMTFADKNYHHTRQLVEGYVMGPTAIEIDRVGETFFDDWMGHIYFGIIMPKLGPFPLDNMGATTERMGPVYDAIRNCQTYLPWTD